MKTYFLVTLFVVALVVAVGWATTPARAQASLPLGMNDLAPDPTQTGFWQRLPTGQGGPCLAPQSNGSAPDTWHYGQSTTNLQGSPVCNYNNAVRNSGSLITAVFTSASAPVLQFSSFLDVESGSGYDIAEVQLSVDGGAFNRIILINKARMNTWDPYQLNLSQCAGHNCQLKFFFDTMDTTSNNTRGWYISGFSVTAPSAATSTPTAAATATSPSPTTPTPTFTPTPTPVIGGTVEVSCTMAQVGVDMRDNVTRPFWVKIWVNSDRTGPPRHTFEGSFSNIVGVVAVFNPVLQGVNTIIVEYAVGNTVSGGYTLHDTVVRGLTCPPVYKDYFPFIAK